LLNKYIKCNLEVSGAVRSIYGSLGVKGLMLMLRKSGAEPPFPYVPSWCARMKTFLLYQTTRGQNHNLVSNEDSLLIKKKLVGRRKNADGFINKTEMMKISVSVSYDVV